MIGPGTLGRWIPDPFFVHDVLPTEYFVFQSLTSKFAVLVGKVNVLILADRTFFGNTYKYDFANLNFNKNPMALNFLQHHFVGGDWGVDAVKMANHCCRRVRPQ